MAEAEEQKESLVQEGKQKLTVEQHRVTDVRLDRRRLEDCSRVVSRVPADGDNDRLG